MFWRFLTFIGICLLLTTPVRAGTIALVLSDDSAPYEEFAKTLSHELQRSSWQISFVGRAETLANEANTDLIIAAGGTAFRELVGQKRSTPLLGTLLSRSQYESSLAAGMSKYRGPISSILLDQPAARQAAFIRQLLPGRQRIGILNSSQTKGQLGEFRKAFERAGFHVHAEQVDHEGLLLPALESLLPRVDTLLAIPDGTVYQRQSIKPLLITAYRHQRPVIAFSSSLVRAGALGALFSTPTQIARQTASLVQRRGNQLPPPMPPDDFSVLINSSVAESLGINAPDETSLYRTLRESGEAP